MKLESVRLLHAQGIPDHYIANQVYQPADEEQQRRGTFLILFDQAQTNDGAFIGSLINTLIREYYRHQSGDRISAFEQTLIRMNEQIKQYTAGRDAHPLDLHGTVILIDQEEVHISHIGTPLVLLARDNGFISLVEKSDDKPALVPSFSVITSGEIQVDDVFILASGFQGSWPTKDDFTFALSHSPLFEAGRAFARILKQSQERSAEVLFVRFATDTEDTTSQLFLDRPLESTGEKLNHLQQTAGKHAAYLISGLHFIGEKLAPGSRKNSLSIEKSPELPDDTWFDESHQEAVVAPTKLASATAPVVEWPPLETTDEEGFVVRTYRQRANTSQESTILPPKQVPTPHQTKSPHLEEPLSDIPRSTPSFSPSLQPMLAKIRPNSKGSWYVVGGAAIAILLVVRIISSIHTPTNTPSQTASERDALVAQAEDLARNAEAAQVKDDTTTALTNLEQAKTALSKVIDKNQNEKSKALSLRVTESIKKLSHATQLTGGSSPQPLSDVSKKVVTTEKASYIFFLNTPPQKYTADTLVPVKDFPDGLEIIDAVAYANKTKVAVLAKNTAGTTSLYSINPETDEIKQLKRTDAANWPETRLLASFENNLYFISATMSKGVANGDSYRIIPYLSGTSTETVTSIVNNGFAFYDVEDGSTINRLAANSPKTPIKLFGLPDSFWPKKIQRILSPTKEGSFALFDAEGKRILFFSTDGAYRQQYLLPQGEIFNDCDITDTSAICTSDKKQVKTFPLPNL